MMTTKCFACLPLCPTLGLPTTRCACRRLPLGEQMPLSDFSMPRPSLIGTLTRSK